MIEEKIFLVGVRELKSEKKGKTFYCVDYIKNKIPKTDFIDAVEYTNIKKKNIEMKEVIGLFKVNSFDKVYLSDIK